MLCGDVLDQLLNKDCFTNTGTTEQTDLTTFGIWSKKVNNLDTCFQDFYSRFLMFKIRRISVDDPFLFSLKGRTVIYGITKYVK